MSKMSTKKKVIVTITASVAGMILLGGAMVAAPVVVRHHRWDREWGQGKERHGKCDAYSSASSSQKLGEDDEFDRYCSEVMYDLAGTLGLSAGELEGELASGKKIMDIANEKGVSLEAMVNSVTSTASRIIEREMKQGDLDPETAESIEVEVADYATWFLQNGNMVLLREHARHH